jgi:signal transduction histidine kinase
MVSDLLFIPGYNVPVLFVIPVLFVGLSDEPLVSISVAIVAVGLDLLSLILEPALPPTWPLTFVALCVVASFSTIASFRRQEREQREQRYRHSLDLAQDIRQPLTVIIGHCQILLRQEKMGGIADSLRAIERAGRRIEDLVEHVVLAGAGVSPTSHGNVYGTFGEGRSCD